MLVSQLLFSKRVAEMAPVTVRANLSGEYYAADISLVALVPYHRPQLIDSMRELAVLSVRTRTSLLPFAA